MVNCENREFKASETKLAENIMSLKTKQKIRDLYKDKAMAIKPEY